MSREYARAGNGTLALSGASQAFLPKNLSRKKIIITAPAAAISLAFQVPPATPTGADVLPTAVASQGLTIPPNTVVTIDDYTGALAIIGTAAQVVSYVEL